MGRLIKVQHKKDILPKYQQTPIELLLEYQFEEVAEEI